MNKKKIHPIAIALGAVAACVLAYVGLILILIISEFVIFPMQAEKESKAYLTEFRSIELPEGAELVKEMQESGHVCGNQDNQAFAGIIIKSDLSFEEIDSYYEAYRNPKKPTHLKVAEDVERELQLMEHSYIVDELPEGNLYFIYTFND